MIDGTYSTSLNMYKNLPRSQTFTLKSFKGIELVQFAVCGVWFWDWKPFFPGNFIILKDMNIQAAVEMAKIIRRMGRKMVRNR